MRENLNNQKTEGTDGTYEQFDTDETHPQDNKYKIMNLFSPKNLIKYIAVTFVVLCLVLIIYNLTKNNNNSNNLEFTSKSVKSKLPLKNDEFKIENELKFRENTIYLDNVIKGTDITFNDNQIILVNVFITINNICSKDNCFDCYINEEKNYRELSDKEAFDKVFKEMDLRNTIVENIYCQKHNPKMPKGDYRKQVHYVWNKYKRKMIPIKGVYYIDKDIAKIYNNEYLQAVRQGYDFTIIDHIYEKNNKNYKYNDIKLKFDEIKLDIKCQKNTECVIGSNEKCNSCDPEQNKYCDTCNEGYYLSKDDKTQCKKFETDSDEINYPELSDKEAFDKVYKEMGLRDTFVKDIYCQQHNPEMPKDIYCNQIHFVWNNYKRKMIPIKGIYYIDKDIAKTYNNEYLQAVMQGYEFTFMDHIYKKDKKYYKYNDIKLKFDEIKFDSKW